jgi:hypothetical protein
MSRDAALALLADLRRRAVHLGCRGDRLRVRAQRGVVSERDRDALRRHKAELLERLELESRLLDLSLEDFGRQDYVIELAVPWLDETIWFVPRAEHVDGLVREGIHRGRIWTARELQDLSFTPNLTDQDRVVLSRLKVALDGEVVAATAGSSS